MLKSLRIQNIILIENEELRFSPGLNVLSGETGSGKSAIMNSLALIAGERADTHSIRHGSDKGVVEAAFEIDSHQALHLILQEAGIDHEEGNELLIRREIFSSGKSRAFVNNQMAQASLLKKLGEELLQIVNQHANQRLFSNDYHREILDLYGDLQPPLKKFQSSYQKELTCQRELNELIQGESQRLREIDKLRQELEELDDVSLKEGEDEELFTEFSQLAHGEEISTKLQEIQSALNLIPQLNRQKALFDQITPFDATLEEVALSYKNALVELQEVSHTIHHYLNKLSYDPERLTSINDRLTLINKFKRKYGQSFDEIQLYMTESKKRLQTLENADIRIEELQTELKALEANSHELGKILSTLRLKIGKKLEKELSSQLNSLNMPHAQCLVSITAQKRSSYGDDRIEFLLIPNKGEHQVSLKDGASGGEISRLLLSLQTLLAGKALTPVLIFDEVDANIGGETAAIVGKKLKNISESHQVLCITHFPQVATQANHHLQISKEEHQGRTFTRIRCLDSEGQKEELTRMVGHAFSA
jgi:DNA repair protein RecN (Recombination protein N)